MATAELPLKERRLSPRWRIEFPVAAYDRVKQEHAGVSADISGSGLGFHIDVVYPEGVHARVRFTLPASSESFDLRGVVRSTMGTRVGLEFHEVDALLYAQLMSAIYQEITAARPGAAPPALSDLAALEERLMRLENAISMLSSELKREALMEEAEALREVIVAKRVAAKRLDS